MRNASFTPASSISDGNRTGTHGMTAFKPWVRTVSPQQAFREHRIDIALGKCADDLSPPVTLPSVDHLPGDPVERQPVTVELIHPSQAQVPERIYQTTPSQRIAHDARIARQKRFADAARKLSAAAASETAALAPPIIGPEPVEDWTTRQISLHAMKEPWFSIDAVAREPRRPRIEEIQRATCRYFNVSRDDLLSHRRTAEIVRPRQVAMYLAKTLTLRSLPEIGIQFGNRDHTTVLHAVRKIEHLCLSDADVERAVSEIKAELAA